jgi:hypothetical protein
MDEVFEQALKIKLQEKQKFEQVYLLTNSKHFVGEQDEIDAYADYIDSRQVIIDQIGILDSEYNKIKALLDTSLPEYNEIVSIEKDIKTIINNIKLIDDKDRITFSRVKESLSQEMSKSFRRLNVSTKYLSTAESISSVFFDRKN